MAESEKKVGSKLARAVRPPDQVAFGGLAYVEYIMRMGLIFLLLAIFIGWVFFFVGAWLDGWRPFR